MFVISKVTKDLMDNPMVVFLALGNNIWKVDAMKVFTQEEKDQIVSNLQRDKQSFTVNTIVLDFVARYDKGARL